MFRLEGFGVRRLPVHIQRKKLLLVRSLMRKGVTLETLGKQQWEYARVTNKCRGTTTPRTVIHTLPLAAIDVDQSRRPPENPREELCAILDGFRMGEACDFFGTSSSRKYFWSEAVHR